MLGAKRRRAEFRARGGKLNRSGGARGRRTDRRTRSGSTSSAAIQGSESSGRRSPSGESPGNRKQCSSRKNHCRRDPAAVVRERQHPADRAAEPRAKHARQPLALARIGEARIERIDVVGQTSLAPQVVPGVFVGRHQAVARSSPSSCRQASRKTLGVRASWPVVVVARREQARHRSRAARRRWRK